MRASGVERGPGVKVPRYDCEATHYIYKYSKQEVV